MYNKTKLFCIVVLMTAVTFVFMSCSKEDKIVGKWKITKVSSELSEDKGESWTFKESKKCSVVIDGVDCDGEWYVSNDELTIYIDENTSWYKDSYFVTKLTGEFSIEELSSKDLSLSGKWKIKWSDGDSESIKVNYEFEKK